MTRLDPQTSDDAAKMTHPAQKLHDTGFGPVYDLGDEPMPSEWRMWVLLAALCAPWFALLFWIAKRFG
jgi:hypothetical protein